MAIVRHQNTRPIRGWDLANASGVGDLVTEFDALFEQLGPAMRGRAPWTQGYPVDLYETANAYVVEVAVPGIRVEDLDISIEGRQLTIQGTLPESGDENRRYWLQSIPRGDFRRSVSLPAGVDADDVEANVHNGMLTLRMPKIADARARKITISNGG